MRISDDVLIPLAKLTNYLLVPKAQDDKSQFLAQAGFTRENPEDLIMALRELIHDVEAILEKTNQDGTYYQVEGILPGLNNQLIVVTIWLQRVDGQVQFVTLKPQKERPNVPGTLPKNRPQP
jgi:hypothetical protein